MYTLICYKRGFIMNINSDKNILKQINAQINTVVSNFLDNFNSYSTHEQHCSGAILAQLASIKATFNDVTIEFKHRLLSPISEEHKFGADFAIIVKITGYNINVEKGILIQNKLSRDRIRNIRNICVDTKLLKKQAEDMLKITPSSYIMVTSPRGLHIIPAIEIEKSLVVSSKLLSTYSNSKFSDFISNMFIPCFVGDGKISSNFCAERKLDHLIINIISERNWQEK